VKLDGLRLLKVAVTDANALPGFTRVARYVTFALVAVTGVELTNW
jgi:hypothetical protein